MAKGAGLAKKLIGLHGSGRVEHRMSRLLALVPAANAPSWRNDYLLKEQYP